MVLSVYNKSIILFNKLNSNILYNTIHYLGIQSIKMYIYIYVENDKKE
jgi:hypothetical protein